MSRFFEEILIPGYQKATDIIEPVLSFLVLPRFQK